MGEPETLPELVARLRARFIAAAPLDAAQLRACATGLAEDRIKTDELRYLVHRLAGSAGTFGFAGIGVMAASIDDLLVPGEKLDRAAVLAKIEDLALMLDGLAS